MNSINVIIAGYGITILLSYLNINGCLKQTVIFKKKSLKDNYFFCIINFIFVFVDTSD